jgi:hypothetical protein
MEDQGGGWAAQGVADPPPPHTHTPHTKKCPNSGSSKLCKARHLRPIFQLCLRGTCCHHVRKRTMNIGLQLICVFISNAFVFRSKIAKHKIEFLLENVSKYYKTIVMSLCKHQNKHIVCTFYNLFKNQVLAYKADINNWPNLPTICFMYICTDSWCYLPDMVALNIRNYSSHVLNTHSVCKDFL